MSKEEEKGQNQKTEGGEEAEMHGLRLRRGGQKIEEEAKTCSLIGGGKVRFPFTNVFHLPMYINWTKKSLLCFGQCACEG